MESSVASCGLLRAPLTAIRGEEKQSVLAALLLSFQVHVLKFYLNSSPSNSYRVSGVLPNCEKRFAGRAPGVLSFRRYLLSMNCATVSSTGVYGLEFRSLVVQF